MKTGYWILASIVVVFAVAIFLFGIWGLVGAVAFAILVAYLMDREVKNGVDHAIWWWR